MKYIVYSTESRTYGYSTCKIDFLKGTKVMNYNTGKLMIVEGIVDVDASTAVANAWMHKCFKAVDSQKSLSLADRVRQLLSLCKSKKEQEEFIVSSVIAE